MATAQVTPRYQAPKGTTPVERLVAALVAKPTLKIDLIHVTLGQESYFLLRKWKWLATTNVKGSEIKLEPEASQLLLKALTAELGL